jgi:hypothetical protein
VTTIYVLDVPENAGLVDLAGGDTALTLSRVGPYLEITADGPIVLDRAASGLRHAVWYSAVAGVAGGEVVQHDKNALRVEAR